jgi:diketogulonate reductase-like aldo/keto reductase
MPDPRGAPVPGLLYGTAWKEEATEQLVVDALTAGFRGIDTANQRKHYFEEAVGRGVARALRDGILRRDQLFLQTKFTFRDGQDHRLPYDPRAAIRDQVAQSLASSLTHLGTDTLDSLVLHGPSRRDGLGADDHDAWRAMELAAESGRVRFLGASNIGAGQLADLLAFARIPPRFVQNRCYATRGWDREVRDLCRRNGITYQPFSLLTANRDILALPAIVDLAARRGCTVPQLIFRFAQQRGMLPLTGTRDPRHMRDDLAAGALQLSAEELALVDDAGTRGSH